ncbi:MAG TPA: hypothetical protein VNS80_06990 [Pseudolysinimonas sp.]|nr:hypothetical protein [Pseudolysinimonas sp.]
MGDVMIVSDVIARMRTDLGRVRREFENANANSERVAEDVGHPRLGEKVTNFAHNWDQRRKELVEQIETVEGQLSTIESAFGEVDIELSGTLDGN